MLYNVGNMSNNICRSSKTCQSLFFSQPIMQRIVSSRVSQLSLQVSIFICFTMSSIIEDKYASTNFR